MGARVLVVEDDPDMSRLIRRGLRMKGFESELAGTLAAARELLAPGENPFDAATVDLQLPDGDGGSLLGLLRERGIPAIVLSGYYDVESAPEIIAFNVPAVQKPFGLAQLARVLDAMIHRHERSDALFFELHELSGQEASVLSCALHGLDAAATAMELDCTVATVQAYWQRIFRKLGVRSREAVVNRLLRFRQG